MEKLEKTFDVITSKKSYTLYVFYSWSYHTNYNSLISSVMTCKLKKRDTIGVIINYIDKYGLKNRAGSQI